MPGPTLRPIAGEDRRWTLVGPWSSHGYLIPDGFDTDLASFPRFIEPIMHRNEWCWIGAGIIHDYLYRTQTTSRREADEALRKVARAEGAPACSSWAAWAAVRMFGWNAWRSRRPSADS